MLPYVGTGLPETGSGKAPCRSSSFLKYLLAVYHSSYPAANAARNSSETLKLFSLGSKSWDGKPKMTALNSLPHSFPWNKVFSPPLLNYVTDYKAFRGQNVHASELCLRCAHRERNLLRLFLKPRHNSAQPARCCGNGQQSACAVICQWFFSRFKWKDYSATGHLHFFMILVLIIQNLPQVKRKKKLQ